MDAFSYYERITQAPSNNATDNFTNGSYVYSSNTSFESDSYNSKQQRYQSYGDIFYHVYLSIFLVGYIGNITISVILVEKMYKRVTFTAIALLAGADLTALVIRFLINLGLSIRIIGMNAGLMLTSIISPNMHVVILFRLRHLLLVEPTESLTIMPSDILKQSGIAWIFSMLCGCIYGSTLRIEMTYTKLFVRDMIVGVLLSLMVLIPILAYHCKKIKALKHSINARTDQYKMNRIISAIVCIQILVRIIPIPWTFMYIYRNNQFLSVFYHASYGLEMFNSAANPLIYFFANYLMSQNHIRQASIAA